MLDSDNFKKLIRKFTLP